MVLGCRGLTWFYGWSKSILQSIINGKPYTKEKKNEFFGFFALTGKATSFLGPLLFGIITKFHSQQMALWVLVILLFVGLILFNRPDDKQADIN